MSEKAENFSEIEKSPPDYKESQAQPEPIQTQPVQQQFTPQQYAQQVVAAPGPQQNIGGYNPLQPYCNSTCRALRV